LQDLPGPKIRLGQFGPQSIELSSGDRFTLTTAEAIGNQQRASVNYDKFPQEVHPGQTLLLADGAVELEIEEVTSSDVHCKVIVGGTLSSHKGVIVPRGAISLSAFTDDDESHLLAGLEVGVDFVALSFVRSAEDIEKARRFLMARHADLPLMAKIEKLEALDCLDDILSTTNVIMVARGDLGVELSAADIPFVQKELIDKARQTAQPVITATQMLRSMVENPHPTRAESTDVANAILDGSDAVMLSEESAVGNYPVEAVKILAEIAEVADQHLCAQSTASIYTFQDHHDPSAAIGHAACLLAHEVDAAAIICCTRTGRTANLVARHRPSQPIVAACPSINIARRMMLTWGVTPVIISTHDSIDAMVYAAFQAARSTGIVSEGDRVVVVGGAPTAPMGDADFLRLLTDTQLGDDPK
jgi:pyruvate kinase